MKPLILITNDDSIEAKGLRHLVDCVRTMGDIYVVAPNQPHSGQSSAFTVNAPLRIIEHPDYNDAVMRSVTGTPVDCVKLAMHHVLPRRPDIILSGINHGSNAGNSIIYSGTMGAALEGCMLGIPSVGYSLLHHSLKANFPAKVKIEGAKVVRAARSHWTEEYQEYTDPHGKPFFWLTGRIINEEPENADTDLYWLDRHFATIVPARADQNATDAINDISSLLNL